MKSAINKKDGYVLAYVVVVIAVVSLIAVAACTTAVRNYKTQRAALSYTQEKYAAEGIVERYIAELQSAAVDVANNIYADVYENAGKTVNTTDYVGSDSYIIASIEKGINDAGIVSTMTNDGCDIFVDGKIENFRNYTYVVADPDTKAETTKEDSSGYFAVNLAVSAYSGDLRVDADVELNFEAEVRTVNIEEGGLVKNLETYYISGVTFEYTSYNVTMLQEGRTGR